jgi:two-component system response regulator YesN
MYRVLIADDEPIERTVICKTMKKEFKDQLEIIQAVNGREAIERFEEKRFHILILDIEMPGINGLEAAEKIRNMDKNCIIIFLTAFDDFNYAKKAITVKALDYLLKPSSEDEIIAVIEEAIRLVEEQKKDETTKFPDKNVLLETNYEKLEVIRMNAVLEEILQFIHKHYIEDISMQDAAEAMNYSNAYFCKLFKQGFDKSFITYLTEYRVEKAKQLLIDVTINVKEISDKVGYKDANYFAKVFKRVVGVTPSEYRMIALGKEIEKTKGDER